MPINPDVFKPDGWYTDEEINALLNAYFQDGTNAHIYAAVFPLITTTLNFFHSVLNRAISVVQPEGVPAVIPVNLANNITLDKYGLPATGSPFVGNHWTLVIIQRDKSNPQNLIIHYIDPLGNDQTNDIKLDIHTALNSLNNYGTKWGSHITQIFTLAQNTFNIHHCSFDFIVTSKVQQNNSHDCGPLLINNARHLIEKGSIQDANDIDLSSLRLEHKKTAEVDLEKHLTQYLEGAHHDETIILGSFNHINRCLGYGFSGRNKTSTGKTPFKTIKTKILLNKPQTPIQSYECFIISDENSLYRAQQLSLNTKSISTGLSVAIGLDYINQRSYNDQRIEIIVTAQYSSIATEVLENGDERSINNFHEIHLSNNMLNEHTITKKFLENYQTHCATEAKLGAIFIGKITITGLTQKTKKELTSRLGFQSDLAQINFEINRINKKSSAEIIVSAKRYYLGLPALSQTLDIEDAHTNSLPTHSSTSQVEPTLLNFYSKLLELDSRVNSATSQLETLMKDFKQYSSIIQNQNFGYAKTIDQINSLFDKVEQSVDIFYSAVQQIDEVMRKEAQKKQSDELSINRLAVPFAFPLDIVLEPWPSVVQELKYAELDANVNYSSYFDNAIENDTLNMAALYLKEMKAEDAKNKIITLLKNASYNNKSTIMQLVYLYKNLNTSEKNLECVFGENISKIASYAGMSDTSHPFTLSSENNDGKDFLYISLMSQAYDRSSKRLVAFYKTYSPNTSCFFKLEPVQDGAYFRIHSFRRDKNGLIIYTPDDSSASQTIKRSDCKAKKNPTHAKSGFIFSPYMKENENSLNSVRFRVFQWNTDRQLVKLKQKSKVFESFFQISKTHLTGNSRAGLFVNRAKINPKYLVTKDQVQENKKPTAILREVIEGKTVLFRQTKVGAQKKFKLYIEDDLSLLRVKSRIKGYHSLIIWNSELNKLLKKYANNSEIMNPSNDFTLIDAYVSKYRENDTSFDIKDIMFL